MLYKLISTFVFLLLSVSLAFGEARDDAIEISGATTLGKSYEFTHTAFVLSGSNYTIDLGGNTVTYNNVTYSAVPNRDFEDWTGNNPDNWTLAVGSGVSAEAIYWGDKDFVSSTTFTLKSSGVSLYGGQSYIAFAYIKSDADNDYDISILNAGDDVLATTNFTSSSLSRGFASTGDATNDLLYTCSGDTTVYIQVEFHNPEEATTTVGRIDIRPAMAYAFLNATYKSDTYHPDLPDSGWGTNDQVRIKNGKIVQGTGVGVRCPAFRLASGGYTISDLDIYVSGLDSGGVYFSFPNSGVTVSGVSVTSTSFHTLNRMHTAHAAAIGIARPNPGTYTVSGCSIEDMPQAGITLSGCYSSGDTLEYLISGNSIAIKEQCTEGYSIGGGGFHNTIIENNYIAPRQGRGILFDSSAGCEGEQGCENAIIRNNIITGLYEVRNPEYDEDSLECVGIRIRNWGGETEGYKDLQIYGNTIDGYTDASGVHRVYGINMTARSAYDDIEIYDNDITVTASGTGKDANAMAFQTALFTSGGTLQFYNNRLTSSHAVIRFGGNDGASSNGITISGCTLTQTGDPPAEDPIRYGYWNGDEQDNVLLDIITSNCDVDDQCFDSSGDKDLEVQWTHTVTVLDTNGNPLEGATVTWSEVSGTTQYSDTTDSNGQASKALVEYRRIGDSTDSGCPDVTSGLTNVIMSPYTVEVTYGLGKYTQDHPVDSYGAASNFPHFINGYQVGYDSNAQSIVGVASGGLTVN